MKFHIGDILSVTTGRLVSLGGIDGVYKILNYMTQDDLHTHQLPRVGDECAPELLKQHPWLSEVRLPSGDSPDWMAWMQEQAILHGEYHEVQLLPVGEHASRDPVEELVERLGPERVIVVVSESKGSSA